MITINELKEHCERQLERLPKGSKMYEEHLVTLDIINALAKRDKQIDLMAEYINYLSDELVRETGKNELKFCDMEICVENDIDCEECIKQYFENKAKEE